MIIDNHMPLPQELQDIPQEKFELCAQAEIRDEAFKTKPVGFYRDALRRLRESRLSVISFWIILLIIIAAIIVPSVTGYT